MKIMKIKAIILSMTIMLTLSGCDVLNQMAQMATFSKCEFKTTTVENLTLGGVNVQNTKSLSDINFLTIGGMLKSIAMGKMPLEFTINLEAKNPNATLAAMNKIEWIVIIDSTELTRGIINERIEIQPNGTTPIPIHIESDILEIAKGKAGKSVLNLGLNLAGVDGTPSSRLTIKIKPTIMVGSFPMDYPGYITVKKDFGSN